MTEVLLDARTINAVLEALNKPISNATEVCARVRILAREGGLQIAEDREIAGGDFSPFLERGPLVARAIQAIQDVEDWCHHNEAQWTGWGDQVVPDGAIRWTWQAKLASDLLKDMVDPASIPGLKSEFSPEQIQFLLRVEERRMAVIESVNNNLHMAKALGDMGLVALQQLPCGVDLHITRLGSKTLDRVLNRKAGA